MKRFVLTLIAIAIVKCSLIAQTPQTLNYQGVARDNEGAVGIGNNNPQSKLQVQDGGVTIANSTDNKRYELNYDASGDYFYLDEYGTARHLAIKNGGNVGVGIIAPTSKLHVNGALTITDGTQGAKKVLVSDANGKAKWSDKPSFKATTSGVPVPFGSSPTNLVFATEVFDNGSGYNPSTDKYTALSDRVYHFDIKLNVSFSSGANPDVYTTALVSINGGLAESYPQSHQLAGASVASGMSYGTNFNLTAGDKVQLKINWTLGTYVSTSLMCTDAFTGFKVSD